MFCTYQGCHPHAETQFPDFSLTIPWPNLVFHWPKYCGLQPIYLLVADKWQIPFSSSDKFTALILQMKSLNSFFAQNVLNVTSFHSFERAKRAREKTFFYIFQVVKIPATTHFGPKLWNSLAFPWLSWYLKFLWPICKIPRLFPDLEEKPNFPDQWPPCVTLIN